HYGVRVAACYFWRGRVIGLDAPQDVGVIRVDPEAGAIPLPRASEARVRQGQRVYAFGSPFGFRFSMSEGIVSAIGRNAEGVTGVNGYTNFIQTDAAVNPGNSGGPLVDVEGRVIGMNTAIVTADNLTANVERQGQSAGIGFAIPLDTIESVADQLIGAGVVIKGYLGVSLADTTHLAPDDLPSGFRGAGVLVLGVMDDQPAARAGLQAGDISIAVDGERTPDSAVLRAKVGSTRPGDVVTLRVVRATERGFTEIDIEVRTGAGIVDANEQIQPVPEGMDPAEAFALQRDEVRRVNRGREALARVGITDFNFRSGDLMIRVEPESPAWH